MPPALRKLFIAFWWALFTFVIVLAGSVFVRNGGALSWAAGAAAVMAVLSLIRTRNATFDEQGYIEKRDKGK